MHKVSEGKLNLMIESTDLAIAEGQFGVVLCADDVADALAELQSCRAAEREQAAPEANTKPLGWVDRLLEDWEKGYENAVDGSVSKTTAAWYINRLREAYSEQAAPEPRKPAKWQRRLAKMAGSLRHNAESGEWEVWWEPQRGDVMDTVDFGKTPQAAVKAAWRAWKEERGE